MITLEKLFHRGAYQIGLHFKRDEDIKARLKELSQLNYSKTFGCWYIPYAKDSYVEFRGLNIPYTLPPVSGTVDVPSSNDELTAISTSVEPTVVPEKKGDIQVADINESNGEKALEVGWEVKGFYIKLPYSTVDVDVIKKLEKSWWQSSFQRWNAKSCIANLEKLQAHFQCFDVAEYARIYELIGLQESPRLIELYRSPEFKDRILIKIKGLQADVAFVKAIPGRTYDSHFGRWSIPFDEKLLKRVIDHYTSSGYKLIDRLPKSTSTYTLATMKTDAKANRLIKKHEVRFHPMLLEMTDTLIRMKYSWRTVTSYTGKLIRLADHYKVDDIGQLNVGQVNDYLSLLAKDDVSNSMINLIQSAVKFYFEKVKFVENFEIEKLKRPRKGRKLPSILSVQEVDRLLRQSANRKHTAILYTIYGGGLRLGEVLSLRVQDIHWDRNQVLIKGGKGNKDRMVMLSGLLKELLKSYFDEYQPEYWLFEGAKKNHQYSSGSVQKMVKNMARKAGISRRVTPHTLRHCFATHLLDRGLDCKFIQELLGHTNIKTTTLYLHVSNRGLTDIGSPLDDL